MSLSESDIDTLVLATVNAPYTSKLGAKALAVAIVDLPAAKRLAGPVSSFFYDVPVPLQKQFAAVHGLSEQSLAKAATNFAAWSGKPWPGLAVA